MKPIKFRLLFNDKIVGYEKWYPGNYIFFGDTWESDPKWLYSRDSGKKWSTAALFHNKKEQSTGLHDSEGKEIYEGDILEYEDGEDRIVVGYEPGAFSVNDGENYLSSYNTKNWKIVGNIHE